MLPWQGNEQLEGASGSRRLGQTAPSTQGFRGEIRAVGEVLFDQWQFMHRCGINAFEVDADVALEVFNEALGELSTAYQPAADTQHGILWRRHN